MKHSTAKWLSVLVIVIAIIAMAIFSAAGSKEGCTWVLLIAVGINLVLSLFLRCHNCGRGQGRNWLFAAYCPYCGESLDD